MITSIFFSKQIFLCSKVKIIWQKCMALDGGWYQNIMCNGHSCFNMYLTAESKKPGQVTIFLSGTDFKMFLALLHIG